MVDIVSGGAGIPRPDHPLDQSGGSKWFLPVFGAIVFAGVAYIGYALSQDLAVAKSVPWILLGLALLIALGFEFVNGFHDTANAVATVIYTRSLPAEFAVMWSGFFTFLGVLTSTGAVAFGIISLLPVELILQVGSSAGFAMVFALLVAAILWNLGTWFLGLPASSSHTMVGSIIGVGLANQFMAPAGSATSGVEWSQATNVGISLLVSPIVGFVAAALLLTLRGTPYLARLPEFRFLSGTSSHADRLATIRATWERYGVMIDPHTADGLKVALANREAGVPMVVLETAQPVKFAETLREALGREPGRPRELEGIEALPQRVEVMEADAGAVKAFIAARA